MHERYAFPFFALALPLAVTSPRWLGCYVVLSLTCFANVYSVYSLPSLHNAGSFRPDWLDWTLFSGVGIAALSIVNTLGLYWVLAEVMPRAATRTVEVDRADRWTGFLGRLTQLPRWQGSQDLIGVRGQVASGGKLLHRLRLLPQGLVRTPELKPRVGVSGGELDGTPQ
jgi:hypothetical protein